MGSQAESRLSRKIMDALRKEGFFVFKQWGNERVMAGLPDLIVCARGYFIGLEVKMPDKRDNTTPIQEHRHKQIRDAGGGVATVCSVQETLDFVNRWIDKQDWERL